VSAVKKDTLDCIAKFDPFETLILTDGSKVSWFVVTWELEKVVIGLLTIPCIALINYFINKSYY
jgi:hypothetical protein